MKLPGPWLLAALCGAVAILLGFVWTDGIPALAMAGGYWFTLGAVALAAASAVWAYVGRLRPWLARRWTRAELAVVVAALFAGGLAHIHYPHGFKILYDDLLLACTGQTMHELRLNAIASIEQSEVGDAALGGGSAYGVKRPALFPFLLSALHDTTGYRVEQPAVLNALLTPALLGLLAAAGCVLAGPAGGALAVLALGAVPLLGHNLTGWGFDPLNAALLLAALLAATGYLRAPGPARLACLWWTTVLLTMCRYESALYALAAAAVTAVGWAQSRRLALPWVVAPVPLFLLPTTFPLRFVESGFDTAEGVAAFSPQYLPFNFGAALRFLLWENHPAGLGAPWVTGPAAVGLVFFAVAVALALVRRARWEPAPTALALFAAVAVANAVVHWCFHWGRWYDYVISRIALPFLTVSVLAAVWVLGRWWNAAPAAAWRRALPLALALVHYPAWTIPRMATNLADNAADPVRRERFIQAFLAESQPGDAFLYTDNLSFNLFRRWMLPAGAAAANPALVRRVQEQGRMRELYVFQIGVEAGPDGPFIPREKYDPGPAYELAEIRRGLIAQREWIRVARVVAIHPERAAAPPAEPPATGAGVPAAEASPAASGDGEGVP